MRAPAARSRSRANRQDDHDELAAMRESMPVARVKLRARASSQHPAILEEKPRVQKLPRAEGPERFGAYHVHECLGEGGMASVHRASRIDGEGGVVALKRLWQHLCDDRDFVESFVQEARLTRLLRHDNIAQTYELGKANGIYYIAMELVAGPTLDAVMRQSRTAAGAIPLPIIVEILIQLCEALDHAHNLNDELGRPLRLIHRDVSPANIIVSNTGTVKLIDFGIAKAARSRVQTQAGYIKGKLAYVAPEYTHGKLDARADLFAVGVVAHEMLTGHRLFKAETEVDTIQKVRELLIQPPSRHEKRVTRELDDIVLTALQRDPEMRWQNAAAMGRALRGVADEIGRVDAREIRRWVEWAFTREPWSESGVGAMLAGLEHTRMKQVSSSTAPPPVPAKRE
ncbi:MAG: serine/threonine protein kinase, partial [Deltaproteobacteria bacterium]|nr:serine/threonine protein kinase [Deltaproteobacteria bacterium]